MKLFKFLTAAASAAILMGIMGTVAYAYPSNVNVSFNYSGKYTENSTDYYYLNTNSGVSILACFTSATELTVPETINGQKVTAIEYAEGAAAGAFQSCTTLKKVTLPSSVTKIGKGAFSECTSLTDINLENVKTYEEGAFVSTKLTNVTLNANVTAIPKDCFKSIFTLKTVTIPSGSVMTSIENSAFANDYALTSISVLPSSLRTIGESAFNGCSALGTITLPESLTSIGTSAFSTSGLTSLTLPKSVKTLGTSAFSKCTYLKSVTMDKDSAITTIPSSCFANCQFETITLPDRITTIGVNAFSNCASLKSFTVPLKTVSIDSTSFSGCIVLKEFKVDSGNNAYSAVNGVLYSKDGKTLYFCPSGLDSVEISSTATKIADKAFYRNTYLSSIIIPSNITEVGEEAFRYCASLKTIVFNEGASTTIGKYAFATCNNIVSVTLPASVNTIGPLAFTTGKSYTVYTTSGSAAETYFKNSAYSLVNVINDMSQNTRTVGDVNNDGSVNKKDIAKMLKHITGYSVLSDTDQNYADYNRLGTVDLMDSMALAKNI